MSLHVAIIMDGNDRWALRQGLPRIVGHRAGVETVQRTVKAAPKLGISYVTLFGFSSDNWSRPPGEIWDLQGLLHLFLRDQISDLHRNHVRLRVIGDREGASNPIAALIDQCERLTAGNTTLNLTIALNYGGRQEIVMAVRRIVADVTAGRLAADAIDEQTLAARLYAPDLPAPDLVIRTNGEQSVSNFLLWQMPHAEVVVTETLWPDFSASDLVEAIREYRGRRRYRVI